MKEMSDIILNLLSEDVDLEVKKAAGKDGRGAIPKEFYKTYSAMANTEGGVVLLGISEKKEHKFQITGISDTRKVIKSLWDTLNNPDSVNVNILNEKDVRVLSEKGLNIIQLSIPRASRHQKPVYLGKNPLTGTYRRNYEGDYRCTEESVRRMLAEQVEDARDSRLLEGFDFGDIHMETFHSYRNAFRSTRPDHPWVDFNDTEFMRNIGGWTRDRQTGNEGLTLAGLLMFGKLRSILDAVSNYIVDYRQLDHGSESENKRWLDRITTDGSWSGNLYDFYRLSINRLAQDLKVPFKLKGDQRVDDTPIHEALREALVNALIHADYSGRLSVLIIKRPELFGFRNPGNMRIPIEEAISGGNSDCRNRNLQKMFQLIGLGEQAGSGLPKVYINWKKQHFRPPELWERIDPDQTLLRLRLSSLIPDEALQSLNERFGDDFARMTETERLALITVEIEGSVTHTRLKQMSSEHPRDITSILRHLVDNGFLESSGTGRATVYYFKGDVPKRIMSESGDEELLGSIPHKGSSIPHKDSSIPHKDSSIPHKGSSIPQKDISDKIWTELWEMAALVRKQKRSPRKELIEKIKDLCAICFLNTDALSKLLGRNPKTLKENYLYQMGDVLEMQFPNNPKHPRQAYRTREKK
ncbi:MAG: putative DNA binding domain-containing protein [Desulfobacteraceae bacterium]|jgi:ATP-dependent DNA helicase RecG|nr:putative DNA binding domain-containing protein [Desulfobacteraceae bacterium]